MRALELGAVDFVTKPKISIQSGMREYSDMIAEKVRAASKARIKSQRVPVSSTAAVADSPLPLIRHTLISSEKLIIIGASTGGL